MHRVTAARCLNRTLISSEAAISSSSLPLFLCPALARYTTSSLARPQPAQWASRADTTRHIIHQRRLNHTDSLVSEPTASPATLHLEDGIASAPAEAVSLEAVSGAQRLPMSCTGCGAFAQTSDPTQLGYYDLNTKRVRKWLRGPLVGKAKGGAAAEEEQVLDEVLGTMDEAQLKELGLDPDLLKGSSATPEDAPVEGKTSLKFPGRTFADSPFVAMKEPLCERCHVLVHERGSEAAGKVEMFHPTVESLRETIEESPHKHNHIYHVVDAADFPMSLIPRLNILLGDISMRTRNRRSRSAKYMHDRKMEISFIITRGDLLGPTKEIVDRMMPYLREVLRDALGRLGGRVRLGNVRCVSASRDWWTKELKQDIWDRGGAGWMVGKVNVGKSRLFEAVFPKGRVTKKGGSDETAHEPAGPEGAVDVVAQNTMDFGDLLPPPRPLEMYPEMPIVSSLPGTTASPIRVPFGNNKGELIDLPGLSRGNLETHVKPEHRESLLMKKRIVPEQVSLHDGRSLLLGGGLIRITPTTPGLTFLVYNFTPLDEHLTATDKAVEFQAQTREAPHMVENIALPEAADKQKLAGSFKLRFDVTRKRAGPVAMKHRGGVPVEKLPFRVLSVDILIEGVGYVEVVAQVRTRDFEEMVRQQTALDLEAEREEEEAWSAPEEQSLAVRAPEPTKTSDNPFDQMMEGRIDNSPASRARQQQQQRRQEEQQQRRQQQQRKKVTGERAFASWPTVEVHTPEGRFGDYRMPINGWLNNKPLVKTVHKRSRPRKSMKGAKKLEKAGKRAAAADL